ncbi:hypothetical protein BIY28_03635 [Brenneria goodwinii]|nr:hypothetical protein BIY28_03635 [Brenneria goodwinii]
MMRVITGTDSEMVSQLIFILEVKDCRLAMSKRTDIESVASEANQGNGGEAKLQHQWYGWVACKSTSCN